MATVYVIRSKEGHTYTGCTEDLEHRLFQHNNHLAGWTKRGTEWKLIYSEEFQTLSEARKRENWLKSGVGKDYLKKKLSAASGS
ncbi:MAG: GIY-YIG nuclease family protein [Bacteroidota bacterium]|jgi:putative endonuclease|nr:GIY-YIG nuclease family protein [Ignavibacteria bacterium]MCU7500762.1 GIY-YIG nuclease family protein [Ignavibacteria bacterium]MCU7513083.1 GIY-YIG nuclease family protein [Ignavibacteria bacterium]MCU7522746.1 GIY-YIG nuclease family protein [Ignavibacteria bacterium]MCU7526737.1 GIY-YIG nuclease family protein [Ignavibacteria bacterium]